MRVFLLLGFFQGKAFRRSSSQWTKPQKYNRNETFLRIFLPTVQYGSVVFNYRYTADSIREEEEDDDALLPTEISSVDAFSL